MPTAIEVRSLRRSYGSYEAVRGIDLTVAIGESVAFLGPNGAGKTTTVEVLEGYRPPSAGTVSVLGLSPTADGRALRKRIGIVLQEAGFPPELTVVELVDSWRRFYDRPRTTADVVAAVGLEHRAGVRAKNLSGGEARRLDLALGIVGRPEVLFLDEPTTGFDPSARRAAWDLVDGLVEDGTTVFLTTHNLDEAQRLAGRIVVIAAGRIVAEGTPDDIGGRGDAAGTVRFTLPGGIEPGDLPTLPSDADVHHVGDVLAITTRHVVEASHAVTGWALEHGHDLIGFTVERRSLEDTYLAIIAGAGDDGSGQAGASP